MKTYPPLLSSLLSLSVVACSGGSNTPDAGSQLAPDGGADGGSVTRALVLGPTNCAAPPTAAGSTTAEVVAGNTQLALDLFGQLAANSNGGNLFFSPYSVSVALEMTYAGAANATATQMATVLHLPSATDLPEAVGALDCLLGAHGSGPDGGQLDIANRLFGQQGFSFESGFLAVQQNDYGAALESVDFENAPDTARQTINSWVSQETEGMIPQLLGQGTVTPQWRLALADALYFHGLWTSPFQLGAAPSNFTTGAGTTVQVTYFNGEASAGYTQGGIYQALELPFLDQGLAMDFIMPTSPDGLATLEASLTTAAELSAVLGSLQTTEVGVELPKLHLDTSVGLVPTFEALGLTLPFSSQADFSGIDGQTDLSIAAIQHEAVLDMDEAGATAAAATVIGVAGNAAPATQFRADHPFVLVLRDVPSGTVLFMGQVMDPTTP